MANIKLSIIIPCYNAEPFIDELCKRLLPQLDEETEVLIIDDGSRFPYMAIDKRFKVIRKENGGVSSARNKGLEIAKGEYIAFIDADDLISEDYIKHIKDKISKEPDVIWLSWEAFGTWKVKVHLAEGDNFPSWNLCVWNRVYKKSVIGDIRFNEKKRVAEDAQFIRDVKAETIEYISKPIYFYRTGQDSLTKRIAQGKVEMNRIVYHYNHITKDMTFLIDEMKKVYDESEIVVMTNKNDIEELSDYALVMKPSVIYGHELKGEKTSLFRRIPKAIKTQVVIYIGNALEIGGVETWIYNFCANMYKKYDIMVCYSDKMFPKQIERLSRFVMVHKIGINPIFCDTLLNMRITDSIPDEFVANQIIQVCHTCRMKDWKIQPNYDKLVYVSKTASETFNEEGEVIHNLTYYEEQKRPLVLITASRFTFEKGLNRMYLLAERFKEQGLEILWLVFTNKQIEQKNGIIRMNPTLDIGGWIERADYLVQLSDTEAFCYSIVEALLRRTPVLTTPLPVLKELGFKEGKDGYILPFDMKDIDCEKIYKKIPKPKYINDNEFIEEQWCKLLGNSKPKGTYNTDNPILTVRALEFFGDLEIGRNIIEGEVLKMRRERALMWLSRGKVELVDADDIV